MCIFYSTVHCLISYLPLLSSCQLKELLSERMEAPVSQQCLIFAGKILKDNETLEVQGIKDGVTIHLVVRSTVNKVRPVSLYICSQLCMYNIT